MIIERICTLENIAASRPGGAAPDGLSCSRAGSLAPLAHGSYRVTRGDAVIAQVHLERQKHRSPVQSLRAASSCQPSGRGHCDRMGQKRRAGSGEHVKTAEGVEQARPGIGGDLSLYAFAPSLTSKHKGLEDSLRVETTERLAAKAAAIGRDEIRRLNPASLQGDG